ncbi:transaldolase [bacterium]|nr:MAG: transaldolase [bacterium]
MTKKNTDFKIKIFADGADKSSIMELSKKRWISGFTTNPTLMRKAGVKNYKKFAKEILSIVKKKPISFEVFSDNFEEMERQAQLINSWGKNVYIKIPITNTKGDSAFFLVKKLSQDGIKVNVTAIFTLEQIRHILKALSFGTPAVISVFAGRIADTGKDPMPIMKQASKMLSKYPEIELLWASPRELLNIFQAESVGCDIITVQPDILKKINTIGKNLEAFSLDTVKMFYDDAQSAGYKL